MKTIEQITDEIHAVNKWDRKHDILKEWANSIIKECADSAEIEIQKDTVLWYVDKQSILDIENKL
jgi:hypothetical protein